MLILRECNLFVVAASAAIVLLTSRVSVCQECPVECPPGSVMENEPVCYDGYVDHDNGGCGSNPVAWDTLECGQTVCATTGTYLFEGLQYRDTDWYLLNLTAPSNVTWTLHGDFDVLAFIIQPRMPEPCIDFAILGYASGLCSTEVSVENLTPGLYILWTAPNVFTGLPCSTLYWGEVTCTPFLPAISDLTASASGTDIILRWSTAPFATSYRIYTSPTSEEPWTLLDSTAVTIYAHVNGAGSSRLFYDVRACSP